MMRMKELLERYRSGIADEGECKEAEAEIERFEALSDYISDQLMVETAGAEPLSGFNEAERGSEQALGKSIQKAVNRKLMRLAVIVAAALVVFALVAAFAISPLLNAMYYNPTPALGGWTQQGGLDFAAYAELTLPGTDILSFHAEPRGFGSYDIAINETVHNRRSQTYFAKIERGKLKNMDISFYRGRLSGNVFLYSDPYNYSGWILQQGHKELLGELPKQTSATVDISFDKNGLTMDEMAALIKKHPDIIVQWVGVYCAPRDRQFYPLMGFCPRGMSVVVETIPNEALYPNLMTTGEMNGQAFETHFRSLLGYLRDRPAFMQALGGMLDLESVLQYVEKEGATSYGCIVEGKSWELQQFVQDPVVVGAYITDVEFAF